MNSNKMTIGERIKQRRESLGLTQRELSERLFVKRETINQWESGTRQIKGDDIARLADTLETTCDYILRGVETEQLHLFKDLGLTGQAVKRLKVMAADCRGGNDALNSLIGNELFSLFVGRWYDYCVLAENLNQTKIELIRALADAKRAGASSNRRSKGSDAFLCGRPKKRRHGDRSRFRSDACRESTVEIPVRQLPTKIRLRYPMQTVRQEVREGILPGFYHIL